MPDPPYRPVTREELLPTTRAELRGLPVDELNDLLESGFDLSTLTDGPVPDPDRVAPEAEAEAPHRSGSFDGRAVRTPRTLTVAEARDIARVNPHRFNQLVDDGVIRPGH
jgi:hypothetical protein